MTPSPTALRSPLSPKRARVIDCIHVYQLAARVF